MKKNNTLALVLLIIIVGFLNADQNIMNSTLVLIEKEFHVNDGNIGFMSALFTVLGAVISIIWGYLSDKKDRKKLFIYSIIIAQIPCVLTAFSFNYTEFFILRILTGIGVGASFPVIFSLIGDMYEDKHRAMAVTWMSAVIGIGQILGQLLGGFLGPSFGWRFPFMLPAIPGLIALLIFYVFIPEPKRGAAEENTKKLIENGLVYTGTIKPSDYLNLAKIKTNLYLFLQGIFGTIPWGAIPLFLVKFLNEVRGFSIEEATIVFMFFGLGMIVGTIVGGIAGSTLFKKKPTYMPLLCSIATFVGTFLAMLIFILPLGKNLPITLLLGFFASTIVSITSANVKAMLMEVNVPENRGAIFSVFNLTDSVGTGLGKFIGGMLSISFGIGISLSVSTIMWVPCAFLLFAIQFIFVGDIMKMHDRMKSTAADMEAQAKLV